MREERESKREQVFDLEKYLGKKVLISFFGGIQLSGKLKGYDQILNIVLSQATLIQGSDTEASSAIKELYKTPASSIMCKGVSICSIDLLEDK